ncbi:YciI family protein [Modestobacter excelsi]|uniref:YciI family protein n=1 Tax=Modestobacter excelsi TaxID=2213161 RepID=UPI00110CE164|nr:YciI family protein [Modestobacter excelsi]
MAQYLVLIYEDEAAWAAGGPAAEAVSKGHAEFGREHAEVVLGGNALQPTGTATTIRDGVVTDGPFAETKEALGGYYLIEADDLDQALAIAKEVPTLAGGVEVRPVLVLG